MQWLGASVIQRGIVHVFAARAKRVDVLGNPNKEDGKTMQKRLESAVAIAT